MTNRCSDWRKLGVLREILAFAAGKVIAEETDNDADYGVLFTDQSALRVVADCSVWSTWTQEHNVAFWVCDLVTDRREMFEDLPS